MLGEYQKRIEAAPKRVSELTELTRDYETFQKSYQSLLAKKEDSNVSANLERRQIGEQFKILDPARMPERPASPNRPMLQALGVAAGIGLGLALAALIEYLDKRLKSEADVKAALNLMVLATVPILEGAAKTAPLEGGGDLDGGVPRRHGRRRGGRLEAVEVRDVRTLLRVARAPVRPVLEHQVSVPVPAASRGADASALWVVGSAGDHAPGRRGGDGQVDPGSRGPRVAAGNGVEDRAAVEPDADARRVLRIPGA